jgi:hypothetical protein
MIWCQCPSRQCCPIAGPTRDSHSSSGGLSDDGHSFTPTSHACRVEELESLLDGSERSFVELLSNDLVSLSTPAVMPIAMFIPAALSTTNQATKYHNDCHLGGPRNALTILMDEWAKTSASFNSIRNTWWTTLTNEWSRLRMTEPNQTRTILHKECKQVERELCPPTH